ncbi:MAG: type II toxin-antitoxin system HicB family antitoxin [Thaumarchaeota archaeon]|nr:type II toxin-antitoxin system HicB family antitoxin [Nitrososphaerota archaeon]
MNHKNKISFTVCNEDGGGFSAQCIEFPGIITQAETEDELKDMINDAVNGYLESFPDEQNRLQHIMKNKVIEVSV